VGGGGVVLVSTWKGHAKKAGFKQRIVRAVCSRAAVASLVHVSMLAAFFCDLRYSIFDLRKYKYTILYVARHTNVGGGGTRGY
jgi:hypothetical protein